MELLKYPVAGGQATNVLLEALRVAIPAAPGAEAGLPANLRWIADAYPGFDLKSAPACPTPLLGRPSLPVGAVRRTSLTRLQRVAERGACSRTSVPPDRNSGSGLTRCVGSLGPASANFCGVPLKLARGSGRIGGRRSTEVPEAPAPSNFGPEQHLGARQDHADPRDVDDARLRPPPSLAVPPVGVGGSESGSSTLGAGIKSH